MVIESWTVDLRHNRIDIRPAEGPEVRIDRKYMIQRAETAAAKEVDKTVDVEKIVKADLEKRRRNAQRAMGSHAADEPAYTLAKLELKYVDTADIPKLVVDERNRHISVKAQEMGGLELRKLMDATDVRRHLAVHV